MFERLARIGEYEIIRRLRIGGMATLYLGRRLGAAGFARNVAIKVVHPHLASDEMFVKMFIDEATISARMHHPNVVEVNQFGKHDGHYYLVMEYVDGPSLADLLERTRKARMRLSPEVAIHIALKVAEGLHAAHETVDEQGKLLGVVHRDVCPENVLVSRQGHVKLIDFGIAKAAGRLARTQHGVKGKYRYMSPEQIRELPADRRSDVFALGMVLWESLTGRPLLDGKTDFEVIEQLRNPEFRAPDVAEITGPALNAVLQQSLMLEADERYATVEEFRSDLATAAPGSAAFTPAQLAAVVRAIGPEADADADADGEPRVESEAGDSGLDDQPTQAFSLDAATLDALGATRQSGPPATPGDPRQEASASAAASTQPLEREPTRVAGAEDHIAALLSEIELLAEPGPGDTTANQAAQDAAPSRSLEDARTRVGPPPRRPTARTAAAPLPATPALGSRPEDGERADADVTEPRDPTPLIVALARANSESDREGRRTNRAGAWILASAVLVAICIVVVAALPGGGAGVSARPTRGSSGAGARPSVRAESSGESAGVAVGASATAAHDAGVSLPDSSIDAATGVEVALSATAARDAGGGPDAFEPAVAAPSMEASMEVQARPRRRARPRPPAQREELPPISATPSVGVGVGVGVDVGVDVGVGVGVAGTGSDAGLGVAAIPVTRTRTDGGPLLIDDPF